MKYSAAEEQELMADLWSTELADNPLAFVKYVYPWGVEGTPLEEHAAPRKWQAKVLEEIGTHISRNRGKGRHYAAVASVAALASQPSLAGSLDAVDTLGRHSDCYRQHRPATPV